MSAPTIKTERLILKNIEESDALQLKYLLCPEIEKSSGPYMPHSEDQLLAHVKRIKGDTSWGITLYDGTFIGDIGVFSHKENKGEMAWYVDPKYWHNGYAYEAGIAVISAMRHICFSDFSKIFSFELQENSLKTLNRLTESYLKAALGQEFSLIRYFEEIKD